MNFKAHEAEVQYQVDPETSLLIVLPRTYALRRYQAINNALPPNLKLEHRGLSSVTYMHHVSKIFEGKGVSYRVRICRTCSGLQSLLELGSYHDVESALLVNDAHELMQGRFKNLHILCREDISFLTHISVRKRGSMAEQPILQVIQERLWKNDTNEANKAKRAANISTSISNDDLESQTSATAITSVNEKINELVKTAKTLEQEADSNSSKTTEASAYVQKISSSMPAPQTSLYPSNYSHSNKFPIGEGISMSNKMTTVPNVSRKIMLFEQFKTNVMTLKTELLFWDFCYSAEEVDRFQESFISLFSPNSTSQMDFIRFKQLTQEMMIPVSLARCLLSSLYPGDAKELAEAFEHFDQFVSYESYSHSRFNALYESASNSLKEVQSIVKSPSFTVDGDSGRVDTCLGALQLFLQTYKSMTCHCDYKSRMCFEKISTFNDLQSLEATLLGAQNQLELRVKMMHSLALIIAENINPERGESTSGQETDSDEILSKIFEGIHSSVIISLIQSLLLLSTLSIVAGKSCAMPSKLDACLSYFDTLTPMIQPFISEKIVWQLYMQAYLDLICASIRTKGSVHATRRVQAFKTGLDYVIQTKHYYWSVPLSMQGSEAIVFYESAFRSYVTILEVTTALEESDFLQTCGLDMGKLLNAISSSLAGMFEWTVKQGSSVMSAQTILSLSLIMNSCSLATSIYPSFAEQFNQIIQLSRMALLSAAERFAIAKVLIVNLKQNERLKDLFKYQSLESTGNSVPVVSPKVWGEQYYAYANQARPLSTSMAFPFPIESTQRLKPDIQSNMSMYPQYYHPGYGGIIVPPPGMDSASTWKNPHDHRLSTLSAVSRSSSFRKQEGKPFKRQRGNSDEHSESSDVNH